MIGKEMEVALKHRNLNQLIKHLIISTINSQTLKEANNNKLHLLFNLNKKFHLQLIFLSSLSEDNQITTSKHHNNNHNNLHKYHHLSKLKMHLKDLELQMLTNQPMVDRKVLIHFRIFSNKVMRISLQTQVANTIIINL